MPVPFNLTHVFPLRLLSSPSAQRDDYVASVETRKGYLSLNAHIQDLQNAALMAAEGQSKAERVQQAFILMSASLDE